MKVHFLPLTKFILMSVSTELTGVAVHDSEKEYSNVMEIGY